MDPDELREWMRVHKRTVRGLAAEVDRSPSTVARWLAGEAKIARTVEIALRALEQHPPPVRAPRNGRRKRTQPE